MRLVEGKNINLRTVQVEDAEFILSLRLLEHKNTHLSHVENDLGKQEDWIKKYKERESRSQEFYFVIESKTHENLGVVRLYDFKGDSFSWGSWLIKDGAPKTIAIESALQVYEFGFGVLEFKKSHFDVKKENVSVVKFHLRFGAEIIREDSESNHFNYVFNKYEAVKEKYRRYLN